MAQIKDRKQYDAIMARIDELFDSVLSYGAAVFDFEESLLAKVFDISSASSAVTVLESLWARYCHSYMRMNQEQML